MAIKCLKFQGLYGDSDSDNEDGSAEYRSKMMDDEIDGAPLSESGDIEDLDGVPLDGAALLKGALKHKIPAAKLMVNDDIDGVPRSYPKIVFLLMTKI